MRIEGNRNTISLYRQQIIESFFVKLNEDYPVEWEAQTAQCELKDLNLINDEWDRIERQLKQSIPGARIVGIKRIQNQKLYRNYLFEKQKME